MSDESESVEAFFEGAENVYEGAAVNFSSEKIVIREIGDATTCLHEQLSTLPLTTRLLNNCAPAATICVVKTHDGAFV